MRPKAKSHRQHLTIKPIYHDNYKRVLTGTPTVVQLTETVYQISSTLHPVSDAGQKTHRVYDARLCHPQSYT